MTKRIKDFFGALFPTPVILATTCDEDGRPNIITLAWVGVVCSNPFMVSASIRPPRYSHRLLAAVAEMVINVPTQDFLRQTDYCGTVSGRNVDKFARTGFTPASATKVRPPLIQECPINLECQVRERLSLGTHDLFVSEVVAVHVDDAALNARGDIDVRLVRPPIYMNEEYWSIGEKIGYYAFTGPGGG